MAKIKTKKAIRKRFKVTSTGIIKCKPSSIRHRLTSKNSDRNRRCFSFLQVNHTDVSRITKYINYYLK